MPKRNRKSNGRVSGDLMRVLRKVVPFLFRSTKYQDTRYKQPQRSKYKKSNTVIHKKIKHKQAKIVRHPAATLTARKSVASAVTASAAASVEPKKTHEDTPPIDQNAELEEGSTAHFILPEENGAANAEKVKSELLADVEEDSFLSKVALKQAGSSEVKKISGWSLLKSRFFGGRPASSATKKALSAMNEKEMAQDSFLQHVEKKSSTSVVGTSFDTESASGLEEFTAVAHKTDPSQNPESGKGRILSAADLRRETQEVKDAAVRLEKEVKEIKEEMKKGKETAPYVRESSAAIPGRNIEIKPTEEPVAVHVGKHIGAAKKSGFQQFLSGIGYIGLGKERLQFIQNLATMLNAGLPLVEAIKTIQMETRPKPMKKLLQRIVDMVDNGSPLWRAMEAQSFFSPHALALVRIGEEAGNLAGNMTYLAAQDEKDHDLRSKVKMAMIYPSIVLTIMAIVVIILGMFVLPNLIGVLISLNVPLPLTTRIVIIVSNGFTEYGAIGIPAFIGCVILLIILNKYTSLKIVVQWITFRIPGVGKLAREATIARFGVILGGLLKAGVPVTEAMQSMVEVTTIVSYRKLYVRMLDHITIGDSFAKSFAAIKGSDKLLPPSVQQLVITGEKSGALADIMLKISEIYDKKASETAQKLPIILEPMLLLFIGSLVGTIAFSILVPIYSIVGNVGR